VGVIDAGASRKVSFVDVSVIRSAADAPLELRLLTIRDGLNALLDTLKPDVIAIERVFAQHNVRSVMGTAQVAGIALLLAAERGLRVDMHCDESDDPHSRHVETLAFETQRLGLQGRVTGSHLTSMHSMDNYYVSKLIPLMAEADLQVVSNPLINITLQGRHDSYPKRRGMTRVPELLAAGVNVAFGQDCAMDPWYSLGSGDMLEVAHMGLHVAQMTSQTAMRQCFDAVTVNPARVLGLADYGLGAGCHADFVLLQAGDPIEALRLRATRLRVYRRGKLLAQTPATTSALFMPDRPDNTSWRQDTLVRTV
jgi:cytosine deaminase